MMRGASPHSRGNYGFALSAVDAPSARMMEQHGGVYGLHAAEEVIDIEAELARLDAEGRSIDFDEDSKGVSSQASIGAICFFFLTQAVGAFTLYGYYEMWYLACTALLDATYCRLINSDPGRLPKKDGDPDVLHHMEEIAGWLDPVLREKQFCRFCRVTRPPRAKHCHKCGCCVAKFDHHCFWIHNCVGSMNHRLFLVFVAMVVPWLGYGVWVLTFYLHDHPFDPAGLYLLFTGAGMLVFAIPLLVGHVLAAWLNVTTWEYVKREKAFYLHPPSVLKADAHTAGSGSLLSMSAVTGENPYNKGCLDNWRRFCCVTERLPTCDYVPVMLS